LRPLRNFFATFAVNGFRLFQHPQISRFFAPLGEIPL
jgi:hypothetical protein